MFSVTRQRRFRRLLVRNFEELKARTSASVRWVELEDYHTAALGKYRATVLNADGDGTYSVLMSMKARRGYQHCEVGGVATDGTLDGAKAVGTAVLEQLYRRGYE